MKEKIFHNWGLKLASLILASILWFLVAKIGDPPDTVTFYNIPVRLTNTELLEKENKVYEVLDDTDSVRVTIRAPRSVTSELRASDVVAEADMSKLTDINTIEINYNVPTVVQNVKGDHDVVRLSVEERATKWIRVQYQIEGEVAADYTVSGATLDQNRIEVSGPKSAVEQISYAAVSVDVTGASTNISMNMEPQFYNSESELLTLGNVAKNVSYIHVDVEVLFTKEVPIELNTMGVPADGYATTGEITTNVETVKIAGKTAVLAGISKIVIPEEELNITGANSDMVNVINLKDYLPDNVRFADNSFGGRITATVKIEALAERNFQIARSTYAVSNLPEGFGASVEEGMSEITVSGLRQSLNSLSTENLRGVIDIEAWMSANQVQDLKVGTYDIPVTFALNDGMKVKDEVTVKVTIEKLEDN